MAKKSKKESTKKESTLYYFTSTGCAFCKQIDPIIEKLKNDGYNILTLDLSEEDNQGLKREIENKYDLRCGTPFLVDGSNGNKICGQQQATEEMIKKWAEGEKIPEPPKPKSPPPPLPKDWDSKEQIEKFTKEYDNWAKENNHLPKLQTSKQIVERFKAQDAARKNNQVTGNNSQLKSQSLDVRLTSIEEKLNKLVNHLGVK